MSSQPGFESAGGGRDLETGIRCTVMALRWHWLERKSCSARAMAAIDPGQKSRMPAGVSR